MWLIRRVRLFLGIVGRFHQGERRYGVRLAWEVASCIHPRGEVGT